MAEIDDYLQPRAAITENVDLQHIQEVGGFCPLCGKQLLVKKGSKVNKQYQIAHIYPNSPNAHQKVELAGLERLGNTREDFENKISLCKNCHGYYDDHTTKEEYLKILAIKKELLAINKIREKVSTEDIEEELLILMNQLTAITDQEIEESILKYKGIKIANKIEDNYCILRRKVEFNACTYYGFIKENMKNLSVQKGLKFELLASEVKTAYLKAKGNTDDKVIIFNSLVEWMKSKVTRTSKEACEVMISFFIQNCEVFDEISE